MDKSLEEWLDENMGLIGHMAYSRGEHQMYTFEDLKQEMIMKVAEVWDKYDEDKGNFTAFLITCMSNKLSQLFDFDETRKHNIYNNQPFSSVTTADISISDNIELDDLEQEDAIHILKQGMVKKLSDKEYERLYEYYFNDKTYKEIGEKDGVTKQAVQNMIHDAENKLRGWMEERGIESPFNRGHKGTKKEYILRDGSSSNQKYLSEG